LSIKKLIKPFLFLASKLAIRLWGAMLVLVILAVAFLWIVQIQFFEPNYISAAMAELEARIAATAPEFQVESIRGANNPMAYLSRYVSGKVFLVSGDGKVLFVYGGGLPVEMAEGAFDKHTLNIEQVYKTVVRGEIIRKVYKQDMTLSIGYPILFHGVPTALFVYNNLTEMQTVQGINRRQLFTLSLMMTAAASILALFMTRQFTQPILMLKESVDRLAGGDLSPVPRLARLDELGQLSYSVEKLSFALQRVDVLRKEVIANVSHELRAPLSLIIGYGEMVRDITWKDDSKRNANLGLIIREANRLSRMVDDILDYSQLQSGYGKLNIARCSLPDLVAEELESGRHLANEHGIEIMLKSLPDSVLVDLDSLKISQALRNLMNNAINHTSGGESIHVSLTPDPAGIRVCVANPGKPIPLEERELIWERYRRVQHQGARREGTGIGLAIVKTILSAHGFSYGVDYEQGMNVFWFVVKPVPSQAKK
jgi:signal transduction histidine kinase